MRAKTTAKTQSRSVNRKKRSRSTILVDPSTAMRGKVASFPSSWFGPLKGDRSETAIPFFTLQGSHLAKIGFAPGRSFRVVTLGEGWILICADSEIASRGG